MARRAREHGSSTTGGWQRRCAARRRRRAGVQQLTGRWRAPPACRAPACRRSSCRSQVGCSCSIEYRQGCKHRRRHAERTPHNPPLTARHVPRVWVAAEDAAQAAALNEDQEAHARAVHGGEGLDGVDGAHDLGHLVGRRRAGSRCEVEGWRPLPPLAGLGRWRRLRRRAPGRRRGRKAGAPKKLQGAHGQRGRQRGRYTSK